MKHHMKALALAAAMMGLQFPAYAGHPYITDNTGTAGADHWQLELLTENASHSNTVDGVTQNDANHLFTPVLTRALSDTLDVALGLSYLDNDGGSSGRGDTAGTQAWHLFRHRGRKQGLGEWADFLWP
jgi:hypothetical protein